MTAHAMVLAAGTGYHFDWNAFWDYLVHPSSLIVTGLKYTVLIALVAEAAGVIIGTVVAVAKRSKLFAVRGLMNLYIWVFRGTPFLVQVAIVYFAGFPFFGLGIFGGYRWGNITVFGTTFAGSVLAGTFALAVNEGAYMAEIVRSGIASIDTGQMEAAQAIGMTRRQGMRHIVLPQAARVVIPPLGNQFNLMLKSTSLLSVISVTELYTAATVIQGQTFQPFEVYTAVALYYLGLTTIWAGIQRLIERRFSRGWGEAATPSPHGSGKLVQRWFGGRAA